jgi:hypothetical protein
MSKNSSKIRESDKKAARLLCASFNESMRNGVEYKVALVKMIESQKQFIPEFRKLDIQSAMAASNLQVNVFLPHELRRNVIQLIIYLITKHINPTLDGADIFLLDAALDEKILPAKEWV